MRALKRLFGVLLCRLGFHAWEYDLTLSWQDRECRRCKFAEFYYSHRGAWLPYFPGSFRAQRREAAKGEEVRR